MMGDNSVLDIRSRQIDIKLIDKEKLKVMSGRLKIINVFGPVLLILFFAFVWNLRQHHGLGMTAYLAHKHLRV